MELDEIVVRHEIDRLHRAYADVITRRAWPELGEIIRPDTPIRIDLRDRVIAVEGPVEFTEFVAPAVERFDFFEFSVLNSVIVADADAGTATARLYMQELRHGAPAGRYSDAFGVYHDRFERDADGRWWFAFRCYRTFARTAAPGGPADLEVFPAPELPLDAPARWDDIIASGEW